MADGVMKMYPEYVMMYILARLQVKSLLRLKCLSETWHALIKSSTFMNFHLNRTTTAKDDFILFKRSFRDSPSEYHSTLSFLFDVNDQIDHRPGFPDMIVPCLTTSFACTFHQLLGPCRGLMTLNDLEIIVLFNPTTRSYRQLQPSDFICPSGYYEKIKGIGFGFDSIANDYKVVRISEIVGDPDFRDRTWRVEVYDSITDSWRDLDHVTQQLPNMHWYSCAEIFYRGALHWFANCGDAFYVLCFDLSTEIFRSMKMPDCCDFYDSKRYGLVVLNEYLTLICYPDPLNELKPGKELTDIWLMKEYDIQKSWVRKYAIRTPDIESPLVIWRDHMLFFQSKSGLLISYNLNSDEVKEYNNLQGFPSSLRIAIYKESLTPIPNGSEPAL